MRRQQFDWILRKPNDGQAKANEKKQLAYWGEQNWLIKVFMFIYNS